MADDLCGVIFGDGKIGVSVGITSDKLGCVRFQLLKEAHPLNSDVEKAEPDGEPFHFFFRTAQDVDDMIKRLCRLKLLMEQEKTDA